MATYIKTLKDSTETNIIYPRTKAIAVFLEDNSTTVQSALDNRISKDSDSSGSLTLGYDSTGVYVVTGS